MPSQSQRPRQRPSELDSQVKDREVRQPLKTLSPDDKYEDSISHTNLTFLSQSTILIANHFHKSDLQPMSRSRHHHFIVLNYSDNQMFALTNRGL